MTSKREDRSQRERETLLAEPEDIGASTSDRQSLLDELRRYRLGEIERGQATVFRHGDGKEVTRVGCVTRLGYPGRGSSWVIGEGPLYGQFWPFVDGVTSGYPTRRAGAWALVTASVRWRMEHPGWDARQANS